MAIRLQRLPDRTPVKMTILLPPGLARALTDYSDHYARCYGEAEPVAELVPAMIEAFLAGDREFARARRARERAG